MLLNLLIESVLFIFSIDLILKEKTHKINKSKLSKQGMLPQLYKIFNKKLNVVWNNSFLFPNFDFLHKVSINSMEYL